MNERQTILLVDDSENDLVLMRFAFEKAALNHRLEMVNDGEEAIAYLSGEGLFRDRGRYPLPVVMLLDLKMPRKSGFEVLEWMGADPNFRRLSAIILTASMRPEDVQRAFELGARGYLVKPATLDELVGMIRSLGQWLQINHFPPLNENVAR